MSKHLTIAIDGPAGAGKSTIAKQLAKDFSIVYVDTGAMYRTVAFYMIEQAVNLKNEEEVVAMLDQVNIEIKYEDNTQHIYLNNVDVSIDIRQQEVGESASIISTYLPVRKKMVEMQQAMGQSTSLVMDGRDIGTHVLTNATLKVYLSADVKVRAKRRYDELVAKGENPILSSIEKEIEDRDYRDMNREHAPLRQAQDAILVDTSYLSIEEVVSKIRQLVEAR